LSFFAAVGRYVILIANRTGAFALFVLDALTHAFRPPFYVRSLLVQALHIGFYSLPMVGMTALFTGAVLALQSYTGFSRFNAESSIAAVVVISITRELGPVLGGLMVAGRVGAAIAAEIGAMRVTQQIDALVTLSVHPIKYLVTPRIVAGIVSLPILVAVADVIGVLGGYLVGVYKLDFSSGIYLRNTYEFLEASDVVSGLAKAAIFGAIITSVGCYQGYRAEKGANGVGMAVMQAVVQASVLILLSNYVLTELFFK
jgi:phospholipid/cholesterol/gamma-HCH transport system permease protein